MMKRVISILLAAVFALTLSMTAFAENSESDETYTVYFYIPDGRTLSAQYEDVTSPAFFKDQAPYVYWFCYDRESHSEWPGVLMQKTDDDCVYQAEVPADAGFLIFNDNGYDAENHQYRADPFRTRDIYIQKEDMEEYYNHYPDVPISYDSVDGMIYVVTDVYLSETLGNSFYFGDWYYYYGDGCCGLEDIDETGEKKENACLNPDHDHSGEKDLTVYFYIPDGCEVTPHGFSPGEEITQTPEYFSENAPYIYWVNPWSDSPDYPGVLMEKTENSCVYQAEIPAETSYVIFSNNSDSISAPGHFQAMTYIKPSALYGANYRRYPDVPLSYENADGMIYVVTEIYNNAFDGHFEFAGDWYYYYGDGCCGVTDITSSGERKEACCLNPAHTHDAFIPGDADRDKTLSVMDATCIQKYKASLIGEDRIDLNAADVDSDGIVTVLDATRIQKQLAGLG